MSGAVALVIATAWVGLYAYGRTVPAERVVERTVDVDAGLAEVWNLVADMGSRPEWHPGVRAIARVEDRDGRAVWREVDHRGDRFDWLVVERKTPERMVIEAADPEQLGMVARWTWELEGGETTARVTLREETRIDNPVWRGIYELRYGRGATVDEELNALVRAVTDDPAR